MMLPPVAQLVAGGPDVQSVHIGGDRPFALIAGPCVIESREHVLRICAAVQAICAQLDVPLIFKSSFDKANRSSMAGYRGIGIEEGLLALQAVRSEFGVPVTTDVHETAQVEQVAASVDLLQVPAFLCRQTDLLAACASTGLPVNVKKGQFMAPQNMGQVVAKLTVSGAHGVMVTERGVSFGYNNLVADMRAMPRMRAMGTPVCFDATHAVQLPGADGSQSGGEREMAPVLARSAVAAGVDAVFLEVHDDPDAAPSDGASMLPLSWLAGLLKELVEIDSIVRGAP